MQQIIVKKQRESNLEVLRILSMMLVMLIHYLPLRSPTTLSMLVENPMKALMNLELHSVSIICVHCFILISGYFGIRWKLKSFGGLIFQLIFWALAGYYIAKYLIEPFMPLGHDYNFSAFISSILTWYQGRWFISAYITLYLLSPLINSFVETVCEKKLLQFIIVFYTYSTIYGWVLGSREINTGLSAISLLGLYTIGAWLRISTTQFVKWNKWYDFAGFIVCTLIMTGLSALLLKLGIRSSIYGYLNPVVILESIFLFQFFRKVEMKQINWINFLASSSFAAFLFHCHVYAADFYNNMCRYLHQYDFALLYVLLFISVFFLFCTLFDKIRVLLFNVLTNLYYSVYKHFPPPQRYF